MVQSNGNPAITTNNATGGTIEGMDITVGTGKTLDVDGAVDIDASSGNMDGVTIGANTTRGWYFYYSRNNRLSNTSIVDINGGAIDNAVIGGTTCQSQVLTSCKH